MSRAEWRARALRRRRPAPEWVRGGSACVPTTPTSMLRDASGRESAHERGTCARYPLMATHTHVRPRLHIGERRRAHVIAHGRCVARHARAASTQRVRPNGQARPSWSKCRCHPSRRRGLDRGRAARYRVATGMSRGPAASRCVRPSRRAFRPQALHASCVSECAPAGACGTSGPPRRASPVLLLG